MDPTADSTQIRVSGHASGLTNVAFSPDGLFLFSSGSEGYMRIYDGDVAHETPFEPVIIDYHEDVVTSVDAHGEYLVSTDEAGNVGLHRTLKDGKGGNEFVKLLTRSTLPARSARFDPKGERVAVASDETIVKVVSMRDTSDVTILSGYKRGVRDVAWTPNGELLATVDSAGQLRVWELKRGEEPNCVHTMDNLASADDSDYPVCVTWHPSGEYFVVATKTNEIAIISRNGWTKMGTFGTTADGHTSRITSLAWSLNGLYLASGGEEGTVLIWNTETREIVNKTVHDGKALITGIAFHPTAQTNNLAFVDYNGGLTKWSEPVPTERGLPLPGGKYGGEGIEEDEFDNALAGDEWLDDLEDAENTHTKEKEKTVEKVKAAESGKAKETEKEEKVEKKKRKRLFELSEAEEDSDDDLEEEEKNEDDIDVDLDDLDRDGDSRGRGRSVSESERSFPPAPRAFGGDRSVGAWEKNVRSGGADKGKGSHAVTTASKGQDSFQPGATPFKEKKRYMAFNMYGLIHVVEREEHQIITIEFHDRAANPGLHFVDNLNFNLGALGELGSVFSCKSIGEEPSVVYYRPYDSWTTTQEWSYKLPRGENAIALAVGGVTSNSWSTDPDELGITGTGTVVVATDRGFIRFFSGSGLQKYVWSIAEDVVSMVAGADWACVVVRGSASALGGKQGLEYLMIDLDTFEVLQMGKVPLRKSATLKWIGFTDEHIPAMYDSEGLLSILDRCRRPRQGRWVPALDMNSLDRREGKQESYWPIGVTQQHVHVIILKGSEQYPHFPTPIFQEINLQFPLLRLEVQQGQLEEQYLRETVFVSHKRDGASPDDYSLKSSLARQELETDKHLLKLIQTSCKADKLEAALDAALMLSQPASLDAAFKIAAFFQLPNLEDRIDRVKQAKTGIRAAEEDNKRKSKWSHLSDDRTIVAAPSRGAGGGFNAASLFSLPASSFATRRPAASVPPSSYAPSVVAPTKSYSKGREEHPDSGFGGSDEMEPDESMDVDADVDQREDGREAKRFRSASEEEVVVEEPAPAPPPKKASNPFARRPEAAKPSAPPAASNPFATKKTAKATDLHRTGSFFNRVEGKEPPKPKSKVVRPTITPTTKPKPKGTQTTLFGLPPGEVVEKKAKGSKKRKADDVEEENVAPTKTAAKVQKPLDSFVKEIPREGEDWTETQDSLETQEEESQRKDSTLDTVVESPDEETQEDGETQLEETQLDESQYDMEETQLVESPKEMVEAPTVVDVGDGMSKLAQFRAPAVMA